MRCIQSCIILISYGGWGGGGVAKQLPLKIAQAPEVTLIKKFSYSLHPSKIMTVTLLMSFEGYNNESCLKFLFGVCKEKGGSISIYPWVKDRSIIVLLHFYVRPLALLGK